MSHGILRQITELEGLCRAELRARWRELFGTEPPGASRAYLVRRLAYRLQELALGGISEATRARLREHDDDGGDRVAPLERRPRDDATAVTGTRFVREWRGARHEVTVVAAGYEYAGRRYRSLTAIATAITGAPWNGRLFFGLTRAKRNDKP